MISHQTKFSKVLCCKIFTPKAETKVEFTRPTKEVRFSSLVRFATGGKMIMSNLVKFLSL
jgi:hypothetical protein